MSSLIQAGLIDELHFFVNPVAIGQGMRVFQGETRLTLAGSTAYPSGVVVNSYLAEGGDNFTVLREGTDRLGGPLDLDALVDYLQRLPQPFSIEAFANCFDLCFRRSVTMVEDGVG